MFSPPDEADHSTISESTDEDIEIEYEYADVTDYPDEIDFSLCTQSTLDFIEITGDLHGNVIRRIFDLVRCGYIIVDQEQYAQLFSYDKKKRYAAFNAICENFQVNLDFIFHLIKQLDSGDNVSERCRLFSDGDTLRFDDACLEKGIPLEFIIGNHEMEFYIWYDHVLHAPETASIEEKYKYTGTFKLGQNQSLVNFSKELIEHFSGKCLNPILDNWEEWIPRRLAHSILFSSEIMLTLSGEPILINSKHSRAGIKTFMLVADWLNSLSQKYGLPYISYKKNDILHDPTAFPQLSVDVNQAFRSLVLTEDEKGKLKIRSEGLRAFVTSYQAQKIHYIQSKNQSSLRFNGYYFCPLYSLFWERQSCSPYDELPSKIGKIRTFWTNGHIGEGNPVDKRENELNLDSLLCKEDSLIIEHNLFSIPCWVMQSENSISNTFTGVAIIYNLENYELAMYHVTKGWLEKILFKENTDYLKIHHLLFADEGFFEGKTLLTKIHIDVLCSHIKSECIRRFIGNATLLTINSTLNNATQGVLNSSVREINLDITDTTITCQYRILYPSETCPIDATNPYFNELTREVHKLQHFSEVYLRHYNLHMIHTIIRDKEKKQTLTNYINSYLLIKRNIFECLLDAGIDQKGKPVFLDLNQESEKYPTLSIIDATYQYLHHLTTVLQSSISTLSLPTDSKLNVFKTSIQEQLSWFDHQLKKEKSGQANFFEIKRHETLFRNFLHQIKESFSNISSIALTHFDQPPITTLINWIDKTTTALEVFLKVWNQPTELTFSYNSTFSTEQNECKVGVNLL